MSIDTLVLGTVAVLAAVLVVQGLLRPEWALVVLIGLAFTNVAASYGSENLLPALLAVAFAAAALASRRGDAPRALIPFVAVAGLLAAYCLVSALWSTSADQARTASIDLGFQLVLAAGVIACATTATRLRWAVWAIIAVGTVVGVAALWQFRTGNYSWTAFGLARADYQQISGFAHAYRSGGPFGDANFFGQMTVVVLALGLERMRASITMTARVLAGLASAIALATILLTYSRGALIAVAVIGVVALLRMRHRVFALSVAFIALVAIVSFAPADYAARVQQIPAALSGGVSSGTSDPAITGRTSSWLVAGDMAKASPLVGIGYGQYPVEYLRYSAHVGLDWRGEPRAAHSMPLQILAELGVVGLLLMATVVAVAFVSLHRARQRLAGTAEDDDTRSLLGGLNDALLGYLVAGLFLHSAHPAILWVLLGLAWSAAQITAPSRPATVQHLRPRSAVSAT